MQANAPSDSLTFIKMHGAGNDFVIIDSQGSESVVSPSLARALGDRHRGVGFDQLAEIRTGEKADIRIDFWNADGSVAGACGNATRCIAQHIMSQTGAISLTIQTLRGQLDATMDTNGLVAVNMGQPQLDWQGVPLSHEVDLNRLPIAGGPAAVGMGNPHCVFVVDDVDAVDVAAQGAAWEIDPLYPKSTNVEFVQIRGRADIRLRVWERNTGITLACGSGACAAVVAAHRRGLTDRKVSVELDGGVLDIEWRDDGVWMSGPTAHVFTASMDAAFLAAL